MKLHGRKIQGANYEFVVIPRPEGDLVFKAIAVLTTTEFDRLCPKPLPGKKTLPGGRIVDDFDDPSYISELKGYEEKRWDFIFLQSFKETEGLEWETVKYEDPTTWRNFESELRDSGLSTSEINMLWAGMSTANTLNQAKIDEAKKRFLATRIPSEELLSLTGGQNNTPNGAPASGSESDQKV